MLRAALSALALAAWSVSATHYPALGLHNDDQRGLAINGVSAAEREHWMRVANEAVRELSGQPCSPAPFGSVVVDHGTNPTTVVCVGANKVGSTGDPTQHGEVSTIQKCTETLASQGLSPQEILKRWRDLSIYTNGEPCPMCSSAIRWAGFKEVIWGTSIEQLIKGGRSQIYIPSSYILSASYSTGTQTLWLGSILANETDPTFNWQFNETYSCPQYCERAHPAGNRVSTCVPVSGWVDNWAKDKGAGWEAAVHAWGHGGMMHDEL